MVETKAPDDIKKMSFEAALAEIEDLVRELESGQGELNEAINAYARGAALKKHCEAKLKEAQAKIDKIVLGPDGKVSSEPADLD